MQKADPDKGSGGAAPEKKPDDPKPEEKPKAEEKPTEKKGEESLPVKASKEVSDAMAALERGLGEVREQVKRGTSIGVGAVLGLSILAALIAAGIIWGARKAIAYFSDDTTTEPESED